MINANGRANAEQQADGSVTDEPRAGDNVLELNVTDPPFAFAADWTDGETYTLKNVVVQQVSPGQFTVVSAEEGEGGAEDAGENEGDESMGSMETRPTYKNPAVRRLMGKEE